MTQICIKALIDSNKCRIWWPCDLSKGSACYRHFPWINFCNYFCKWQMRLLNTRHSSTTNKKWLYSHCNGCNGWVEVNEARPCYQMGWKPGLLQSRSWGSKTSEHHEGQILSRRWEITCAFSWEEKATAQCRGVYSSKGACCLCQTLPGWLLCLPHSIFSSLYSPTPVSIPVTPQQLLLRINPLPQIFCVRRELWQKLAFHLPLPNQQLLFHFHLKPSQNITNSWRDVQSKPGQS